MQEIFRCASNNKRQYFIEPFLIRSVRCKHDHVWRQPAHFITLYHTSGYIMRAFAKAPQISSPSATTTRSSLFETRSFRCWTSHRSRSRPLSAWPTRLFLAARSACSSWSTLRRVDAPPTNGSGNMGNLWQARGRPHRLRRQHSLPNILFQRTGMRWPTIGPNASFMLFPDRPDPAGNQANQGTEAQSSVSGPALEEPELVLGACADAHCSPVAHSPETRPPLLGKRNDLAPPARSMGATSLASRWEPSVFPENVLNTISLRLEHHLWDASMPLSGLSSPPGVLPVAQTQRNVTYRWYCPFYKSCWKRVAPPPRSRSM